MEDKEIETMTTKQLKAALKSRKMSTKGSREELIDRLKAAVETDSEESDASDSASEEAKTPRSHIPKPEKDNEVDDLAPVSDRPNTEEPPSMMVLPSTTKQELTNKPVVDQDEDEDEDHPMNTELTSKVENTKSEMNGRVIPEWRNLHVPDEWLPMPLIRASNLPMDTDLELLKNHLEQTAGLKIVHAASESEKQSGKSQSVLLRLQAPKEALFGDILPSSESVSTTIAVTNKSEEECDVRSIAEATSKQLISMDLNLGQKKLNFEAPLLRTTLFVHNLEESYKNKDDSFRADMRKHGTVIRCFIVRNAKGESKDYGFVEYLHPSEAMSAKEVLDKKSAQALSEFKKARSNSTSGANMVPLKRLRCEWAFNGNLSSLYSKICYVSNLHPNFDDREVLKSVFAPYGTVLSCNIRTRLGIGPGCGFVDFEKGEDAEKALKELDGRNNAKLGLIHVSFVNPGKFPGEVQSAANSGGGSGSNSRQAVSRRQQKDNSNGNANGVHVAYATNNRNSFYQHGRPPFDVSNRGRTHRAPRGKNSRGACPPLYQSFNQAMYHPYYGSYGPQNFMHPAYYSNGAGAYNQFPPQGPGNAGFAPNYSASGGYRTTPSVPPGKVGYGVNDPEYPGHSAYNAVPYAGGAANYQNSGASHPNSAAAVAAATYGQQGMTQSGYPSSYGSSYQAAAYGQPIGPTSAAAGGGGGGYAQHSSTGGGNFTQQQGNYSQMGYGYGAGGTNGGNSGNAGGGGQVPGSKREHDYDTNAYGGGPHYGKKPRY